MVVTKTATNSSASSSSSSVSSGVTSTVQRNRHIPISIASKNASSQLRKPSPKKSTIHVQMNEFSVDFGDGQSETSTKKQISTSSNGDKNESLTKLDKKSASPTTFRRPSLNGDKPANPQKSLDKKSGSPSSRKSSNASIGDKPSLDKKSASPSSRKSSIGSNGDKKPSEKTFTNLDRKTLSADRKSSISSTTSDKKASSLPAQVATTSNSKSPSISSIGKNEPKEQKSQDDSSSQIVVAEIHRSAEDDQLLKVPQKEKSHEEEYRNSQTSDSVAVEDEKTVKNEEELEESSNQLSPKINEDFDEENIQEIIVIGHESEIEVDVSERKNEEGQITTKIILDKNSRAVAAQDLEIEIRREIHTEVSPPISPEPPKILPEIEQEVKIEETVNPTTSEIKEIDEMVNDEKSKPIIISKLEQVNEPTEEKIEEKINSEESSEKLEQSNELIEEKIEETRPKSDSIEDEIEESRPKSDSIEEIRPKNDSIEEKIEESKPKSDSIEEKIDEKVDNDDDIKPFVFRESQTPQKQQFRDVAIRIIEEPKKKIGISKNESENPKQEHNDLKEKSKSPKDKSESPKQKVGISKDKSESPKQEIEISKNSSESPKNDVEVSKEKSKSQEIEISKDKSTNQEISNEKSKSPKQKMNSTMIIPESPKQETTIQPISQKVSTPSEEVNIQIEERKKSVADLAEVRVYRERYSEAPILPYPINSTHEQVQGGPIAKVPQPRLDLSNLKPRPEDNNEEKKQRRPVITPISPGNKSPIVQKEPQRPRIIEDEPLADVDEAIERLKREPIRLNIASSLNSPPATASPPSQYENKPNNYPSSREINGLYRPHPLYPEDKRRIYENCELGVKAAKRRFLNGENVEKIVEVPNEEKISNQDHSPVFNNNITKTTTTTTLIATVSPERNGSSPSERQLKAAASPTPSGRLSVGTGERSENDFTPRTLSRVNHLNVIMECKEKDKDAGEVIHHHPIFMRDTSKYWYKPTISREDAIAILKDKEPGTFVVRDSNSFPGAFGLALKVSQAPAGVLPGDGTELVRHFLIEPSPKGVKLKGCSNEPVFGTLAALIYQHSITPLALPAKLILPDYDPASTPEHLNANQALLERGAACNVTYICSLDTESLTGPEAVRRAVSYGLSVLQQKNLKAVPVHFKVSSQGITLTDNTRSLFFRRHYPVTTVTFAGIDPESRLFDNNNAFQLPSTYIRQAPMFGFVARKSPSSLENTCHVFGELDPEQPASAVVRFITNVMMVQARAQQQQIHRAVAGV